MSGKWILRSVSWLLSCAVLGAGFPTSAHAIRAVSGKGPITPLGLYSPVAAGAPGLKFANYQRFELEVFSQDPQALQQALFNWVGENSQRLGGLKPGDFKLDYAYLGKGQKGPGSSYTDNFYYVQLGQRVRGLPVAGGMLNFAIRLVEGRTIVEAVDVEVYPEISLPEGTALNEEEIHQKSLQTLEYYTLGIVTPGPTPQPAYQERRIAFLGNKWRVVDIRAFEEVYERVAVDVYSGETFKWDDRYFLDEVSGKAEGLADPLRFVPGNDLERGPLGRLQVKVGNATLQTTDSGEFSVEFPGKDPVLVEASLGGAYTRVRNMAGPDAQRSAQTRPGGESVSLLFNSDANVPNREEFTAEVNAIVHIKNTVDYLVARNIPREIFNEQTVANVNIKDDCNAFYRPGIKSTNYFGESEDCINTAKPDVEGHEYGGHYVDDRTGGIRDGALSEAKGDIVAMYMARRPQVGVGFFKKEPERVIRDGRNNYQYNRRDEVHQKGQAFMGFAWKLVQNLIPVYGGEDSAWVRAEALVLPSFLYNAPDIPAAIAQVVLRATDAEGKVSDAEWAALKGAANAHGIEVQRPGLATASLRVREFSLGRRILSFLSNPIRALGLTDLAQQAAFAAATP